MQRASFDFKRSISAAIFALSDFNLALSDSNLVTFSASAKGPLPIGNCQSVLFSHLGRQWGGVACQKTWTHSMQEDFPQPATCVQSVDVSSTKLELLPPNPTTTFATSPMGATFRLPLVTGHWQLGGVSGQLCGHYCKCHKHNSKLSSNVMHNCSGMSLVNWWMIY